ncbi:MAG: hypothetical protein WCP91_02140 [Candidatus Berkelbacteria bacterium]
MLISAHALTGAFIGKEIGYPPLAFLAGVVSHLLLDCIPHNDGPDDAVGRSEDDPNTAGQYALVAVDIILAIIAFGYFYTHNMLTAGMFWGAFGGIFPDFVDNNPLWSKRLRKLNGFKQFHQFHYKIQQIKTPMWFGLATQYAIAAIFLWLILR